MYSSFKSFAPIVKGLALFLLCAALGFSYAIGTQAVPAAARGTSAASVQPRYVGSSTLRFLAPLYLGNVPPPDNNGPFDLGDAFLGSSIQRYISATGGVRPYYYTGVFAGAAGATGLTVSLGGVLTGAVLPGNATDIQFTATVRDTETPTQQAKAGGFNLFTLPFSGTIFRFAQDHLNSGILGQSYLTRLETIGGKGIVKFSVVPGSVTFNGVPHGVLGSLEDLGFSVSQDGMVYGRPLKAGLIGFTMHATDALKRVAKNRSNAVPDQVITFNVEDSRITANDQTSFSVSVSGNTARTGGDQIKFNAIINLGRLNGGTIAGGFGTGTDGKAAQGEPLVALVGKKFSILLGGARFDGYIGQKGAMTDINGKRLVFADGSTLSGIVDPINGTAKGTLKFANLSTPLDAANIPPNGTRSYGVAILFNDYLVAADMLQFSAQKLGVKYSLVYNLGKFGTPMGGGFQIYAVQGKDGVDIAGNPSTSWVTKFLIAPRFGIDVDPSGTTSLTPFDSIGIRIGTGYVHTIPGTSFGTDSKGTIVLLAPENGAGMSKLKISPQSFSGVMITNQLSPNGAQGTAIPVSTTTPVVSPLHFTLGIDINRSNGNIPFTGEDGKFIFADQKFTSTYVDRTNHKYGTIHGAQN